MAYACLRHARRRLHAHLPSLRKRILLLQPWLHLPLAPPHLGSMAPSVVLKSKPPPRGEEAAAARAGDGDGEEAGVLGEEAGTLVVCAVVVFVRSAVQCLQGGTKTILSVIT